MRSASSANSSGGADREAFAEQFLGSVHRRDHALGEDAIGFVAIVGDVAPHGREPRSGTCRRPSRGRQAANAAAHATRWPNWFRRRVVGGGQPPVGEPGHTPQPGIGTPAADPDRWTERVRGPGRQDEGPVRRVEATDERRTVRAPKHAERTDRLVEPLPTFREVETDGRVVVGRRARAHRDHQAAARQAIDRTQ